MVRRSNPGRGEIFRTCQNRSWGPPSLLYNGYRVFSGVKSGWGVRLTPRPLLVPWSRKRRAISLLPLLCMAYTEPQYLYKSALYCTFHLFPIFSSATSIFTRRTPSNSATNLHRKAVMIDLSQRPSRDNYFFYWRICL